MTAGALQPLDAASIRAHGLDPQRLPRHLAIIMDGNGRWARQRGWQRMRGHRQGADVVRAVTTECARLGIGHLTLYAFSSENWSRPQHEIDYLMGLLERFLDDDLATLTENDIRFRIIGQEHRLPEGVRMRAHRNMQATVGNRAMTMTLALSYGGRDELVDAVRSIAARVAAGELDPGAIDEAVIGGHLYDPDAPDVDLLVRTAGEQRVSNFLPWQSVYAEYVSVEPYWPDFQVETLYVALREFQARERRFGRI